MKKTPTLTSSLLVAATLCLIFPAAAQTPAPSATPTATATPTPGPVKICFLGDSGVGG
jgi:hypothetical protein